MNTEIINNSNETVIEFIKQLSLETNIEDANVRNDINLTKKESLNESLVKYYNIKKYTGYEIERNDFELAKLINESIETNMKKSNLLWKKWHVKYNNQIYK